MVLGLAVCATFVLHQPKSNSEPTAFEAQISEFAPLQNMLPIGAIAESSIEPNPAELPTEAIGTDMMVGELLDQADQVVFTEDSNDFYPVGEFVETTEDNFDAPALSGTTTDVDEFAVSLEETTEEAVSTDAESTQEFDFDSLVMEDSASDEFNVEESLETAPTLVASDNEQVSATVEEATSIETSPEFAQEEEQVQSNVVDHHYQRPNSRWKRNPFMDQANLDSPAPKAETTPDPETDSDSESIIMEPFDFDDSVASNEETKPDVASVENNSNPENDFVLTQAPEKSVLQSTLSDDSNQFVTPEMPEQIQMSTELEQFAEIAPSAMGLSEAVAQQAVHHIEYGKSLARRGASQAAGQEFFSALKVIAQANDSVAQSNTFSKSLAQAVLAMREAKDFVNPNVEAQMVVEVSGITESHRSNIVSPTESKTTTPTQAMLKYFAFAQQKLDEAGGRNPVTAEALYCLGKLHTAASANRSVPKKSDVAKAITFHRAALQANKNNHRSANELGVLMAKTGQLAQATSYFKQSLISNPTPQTWQNLAKVHERLGEQDLASLAKNEFSVAVQTRSQGASAIQWLPTTTFNESAPMEFSDNTRVASRPTPPVAPKSVDSNEADTKKQNKSLGQKLKDLF